MSAETNLLVHFVACDVDVEFQDVTYTIGAMTAVEWMILLNPDAFDPYEIFPVLAGSEAIMATEDAIWEEKITTEELTKIALDVIGTAGGRDWWQVIRYLGVLKDAWDSVGSSILARGVDVAKMPLAALIDLIRLTCVQQCEKKELAAFLSAIETPPKGFAVELDIDAEERAFQAAMSGAQRSTR